MKALTTAFALSILIITGCTKEKQQDEPVVFSAAGNINEKLNAFRNTLGTENFTTGQTTGRREINWDGVPDNMTGIKLPNDFFNPTETSSPESRKRGLLYAASSDAMVSKTSFAEVNTEAASEFSPFSGNKSFAVVNALEWPVEFRVSGTNTAATIKGMGIVFSDVDKANSTFIEFFEDNTSLGKYYAAPHDPSGTYSFLGVYFPNGKITSVKVGHEGMLASGEKDITQGGNKDLVVLDDFIYSEPLAR